MEVAGEGGEGGDILIEEDMEASLYRRGSWHSVNASDTPNSSHRS
jgi:membrane glycosyltransferase